MWMCPRTSPFEANPPGVLPSSAMAVSWESWLKPLSPSFGRRLGMGASAGPTGVTTGFVFFVFFFVVVEIYGVGWGGQFPEGGLGSFCYFGSWVGG